MSRKFTSLVAAAALALTLSGNAFAASTVWLRVIVVKTDNVTAFTHEIERGRALMKKLGLQVTTRIWRRPLLAPMPGRWS